MVALAMIVGHELGERATETPFTERNHAVSIGRSDERRFANGMVYLRYRTQA